MSDANCTDEGLSTVDSVEGVCVRISRDITFDRIFNYENLYGKKWRGGNP